MATDSAKPLAVVTGASSGIGHELARQFAQHGYDLLVCAEDDGIRDAARTFEGDGAEVQPVVADLATYDGVEKLYGAIKDAGRPVDAVALNAGVGVGGSFVTDTKLEEELNLIQLNVASTVHLAKRVLPDMAARGRGHVLITASVAGTMPTPLEAVYGASKAFVLSFAESLHFELKDKGVTVTALLPGPTDTNFFHRAGMDDTQVGSEGKEENSPTEVARQGFEALMAGREKVVAGSAKLKLQQAAGAVLPDSVKAAQHKGMAEPGSAKQ